MGANSMFISKLSSLLQEISNTTGLTKDVVNTVNLDVVI